MKKRKTVGRRKSLNRALREGIKHFWSKRQKPQPITRKP